MTDEIEIEEILDADGFPRRLGSLPVPDGFVSSFNTYESEHPVLDDSDIKKLIQSPVRVPRRAIFGDRWIMDQKNHGSCNGFAGAGALSKARYFRGIQDGILLSGAYLYSLINGGRDQGSALEDGLKAVQRHGIAPAELVPWDQIYSRQQPSTAKAEAAKYKGLSCWAVQTKQGFRSALALGFPVIVAVHAGSNFSRINQQGISGVDNGIGNHAVHCDGIEIVGGKEVYDHVGSWGLRFGTKGRSYLTWDSFTQTFGRHTFYAIGSTREG